MELKLENIPDILNLASHICFRIPPENSLSNPLYGPTDNWHFCGSLAPLSHPARNPGTDTRHVLAHRKLRMRVAWLAGNDSRNWLVISYNKKLCQITWKNWFGIFLNLHPSIFSLFPHSLQPTAPIALLFLASTCLFLVFITHLLTEPRPDAPLLLLHAGEEGVGVLDVGRNFLGRIDDEGFSRILKFPPCLDRSH